MMPPNTAEGWASLAGHYRCGGANRIRNQHLLSGAQTFVPENTSKIWVLTWQWPLKFHFRLYLKCDCRPGVAGRVLSSWFGANFDLGALRSFRELLSQPMYFNESFIQCELLGQTWHRPMNFLGRGGSWVVTHAWSKLRMDVLVPVHVFE